MTNDDTTQMTTGPLRRNKAIKRIKRKNLDLEQERLVHIDLDILLSETCRRVAHPDLHDVTKQLMVMARTLLESKYNPYDIEQVSGEVTYAYIKDRTKFTD